MKKAGLDKRAGVCSAWRYMGDDALLDFVPPE